MGAIRFWKKGKDKPVDKKPEVWSKDTCEARVRKAMQLGQDGVTTLFANAARWVDAQPDKDHANECLQALLAAYDRLSEPAKQDSFFD